MQKSKQWRDKRSYERTSRKNAKRKRVLARIQAEALTTARYIVKGRPPYRVPLRIFIDGQEYFLTPRASEADMESDSIPF